MISIERYEDLATPYWKETDKRPKAMQRLRYVLRQAIDLDNFIISLTTNFDIDTAVGNQLDMIAKQMGISRDITVVNDDGEATHLSDDDLRYLIRGTIIRRKWDGSIDHVNRLAREWIKQNSFIIVEDDTNHCMDVTVTGHISYTQSQLIASNLIIPAPIGYKNTYHMQSSGSDSTTINTLSGFGFEGGMAHN